MATSSFAWQGTLRLLPTEVQFICETDGKYCKPGTVRTFSCGELAKIVVDKEIIREIAIENFKYRFTLQSEADATTAFTAIKRVCGKPTPPLANSSEWYESTSARDPVEGVWKGSSPGRDKLYEAEFKSNGQAFWKSTIAGSVFLQQGTWKRSGNKLSMEFLWQGKPDPAEATVLGDTMTGSSQGGRYKFTLIREGATTLK
jgi:hypothetical protein